MENSKVKKAILILLGKDVKNVMTPRRKRQLLSQLSRV